MTARRKMTLIAAMRSAKIAATAAQTTGTKAATAPGIENSR